MATYLLLAIFDRVQECSSVALFLPCALLTSQHFQVKVLEMREQTSYTVVRWFSCLVTK